MIEIGKKNFLPVNFRNFLFSLFFALWFFALFIFLMIKFYLGVIFALFFLFFVGIPLLFYIFLYIKNFSFVFDQEKITVNSGILIKRSKTISFKNIQSVETITGIVEKFFNISRLEIFTASPKQIFSLEGQGKKAKHLPDITLYLLIEDAQFLKDFILEKKPSV
jgi:uncharacterized membrane protein YdbT with pleckstrin-like domain